MKVQKQVLAELESVYAVCRIELSGQTHLMAATEGRGKCLLFSPPRWEPSVVWDGPGGTMSLIPMPDRPAAMLAVQQFFPGFQSEEAIIVCAEAADDPTAPWTVRRILDLPFVHRIERVESAGVAYLVAATLCAGKAARDDWSQPGSVYAGVIPDDPAAEWSIRPILDGVGKNHGMCVATLDHKKVVLISGVEGLFCLHPPGGPDEEWRHEHLLQHEISDVSVGDADGDGSPEIAAIEPFHGDSLLLYKFQQNRWRPAWWESLTFGHVVWVGQILGRPGLLAASRGGEKELALFRPSATQALDFERTLLDIRVGTSNVAVLHKPGRELILAANHGVGEVVLYELSE